MYCQEGDPLQETAFLLCCTAHRPLSGPYEWTGELSAVSPQDVLGTALDGLSQQLCVYASELEELPELWMKLLQIKQDISYKFMK